MTPLILPAIRVKVCEIFSYNLALLFFQTGMGAVYAVKLSNKDGDNLSVSLLLEEVRIFFNFQGTFPRNKLKS